MATNFRIKMGEIGRLAFIRRHVFVLSCNWLRFVNYIINRYAYV